MKNRNLISIVFGALTSLAASTSDAGVRDAAARKVLDCALNDNCREIFTGDSEAEKARKQRLEQESSKARQQFETKIETDKNQQAPQGIANRPPLPLNTEEIFRDSGGYKSSLEIKFETHETNKTEPYKPSTELQELMDESKERFINKQWSETSPENQEEEQAPAPE